MYIKPKLSISKSSSNIDKIYTRNKTTLSKFNYNIVEWIDEGCIKRLKNYEFEHGKEKKTITKLTQY